MPDSFISRESFENRFANFSGSVPDTLFMPFSSCQRHLIYDVTLTSTEMKLSIESNTFAC
jgi:hypothetical protein